MYKYIYVSTNYFEEGAAGFSQPLITDILGWIIHCPEGCLYFVECLVISWHLLDASIDPPPPVVTVKNISRHW